LRTFFKHIPTQVKAENAKSVEILRNTSQLHNLDLVQTFYITAPATVANKGGQGLIIDLGGPLPYTAQEDLVEKYQKFKTRLKKLGSLL